MSQGFDNLCTCCNNCHKTSTVVETTKCVVGTEASPLPDWFAQYPPPPALFTLQSETTAETGVPNESVSQTVTFLDSNSGDVVDDEVTSNSVAMVDNTKDLSLGSFLARPTLIQTKVWSTSEAIGVTGTFQPWYEFLNNTVIKRKLENYAFIRGNLHVKTIVNGTPFQYGSIRMCYKPLLGWIADPIRASSFSAQSSMVTYSQIPGYYIFPEANAGGSMTLPFFLHKNWMDLTDAAEVQNMGTMVHAIYAPLQVAVAGGSTDVTLRTYAWMTEVELMGSTNKLSLQGDEYGKGIISQPASAIAAIASKLTEIPVIGTFARATSIGASAISSIASLFGYTNVPVIADVHAYQPMNAPMLATAHIGTPIQKLSYDPKQELSIDPAPHGIGNKDELAISYIKSKESFFGKTDWSTSDADGTQIFNVRVCPVLFGRVDINNSSSSLIGHRIYHTPLSYMSALFAHWRGDIKFRFKIVCTKFHKGRLKISYDPTGDITASDPGENAVYTEIIDIGEHTDITINVPYHQDVGWLKVKQQLDLNWTTGTALAPRKYNDNGVLTVRVLNSLTAPASGSISILCYVSGGENFEFANPTGFVGVQNDDFPIPSFFELQSEDTTSVESYEISMGNPSVTTPDRYALNFGECIGSLRNVIHRFSVFETLPGIEQGSHVMKVLRKVLKRMPYTNGFYPGWTDTVASNVVAASGSSGYVWNTMHPLPYITGMYLGYRGSTNYCITPSTSVVHIGDLRVSRSTSPNLTDYSSVYFTSTSALNYAATTSAKARILNQSRYQVDGTGGMAITSTDTNGSLVFNYPDYNNYNFSLVDPNQYALGNTLDGTRDQNVVMQYLQKRVSDDTEDPGLSTSFQFEVAAGPDFTCLFWYCCPTLDYLKTVPQAP